MITSGDCTRVVSPTCSLSQPSQLSQPLHHHSLEHFGHISATFQPSFLSSVLLNASVSHDITGCHHPCASLFERHHQPHSNSGGGINIVFFFHEDKVCAHGGGDEAKGITSCFRTLVRSWMCCVFQSSEYFFLSVVS